MKSTRTIVAVSTLMTLVVAGLICPAQARAKEAKALELTDQTKKLEVRYSQIGFRSTLLFYTFADQKTVLKLHIGNQDKTFPMTATFYVFEESVTDEGLAKWLNNQHSDGIYPEVPEPKVTHKAPAKACVVTSHKLIDHSKQQFGEYDNYAVSFEVKDYNDMMGIKLKGFKGETKVHVRTK